MVKNDSNVNYSQEYIETYKNKPEILMKSYNFIKVPFWKSSIFSISMGRGF